VGMSQDRWRTSRTTVYNVSYHLIWCPKYRRDVLVGDVEKRLKYLLYQKASDIKVDIEKMEVMPDHVHLFIKTTPVNSPHYIVQQLKGFTSRNLRKEFKTLRTRIPTLWTRSYYVETIGHISEDAIKRYIADQKKV
jgi:putative transposase